MNKNRVDEEIQSTLRLLGAFGSDIYAAGTYSLSGDSSGDTLLHAVMAVEYVGTTFTLTNVLDVNGLAIDQKIVTGAGVAINSAMGLQTFREDVAEFTTDAVVKVWYAN